MSPLGQMLSIKALGVTSWEVQIPRQEGFDKLSRSPVTLNNIARDAGHPESPWATRTAPRTTRGLL